MKQFFFWLGVLTVGLFVMLACTGCASFETTAYRTIGSVAVSVDTSMNIYGDLVRAGKVSPEQQLRVKALYERYQAGMRITHTAVGIYQASKDKAALRAALDAIVVESSDLSISIKALTR